MAAAADGALDALRRAMLDAHLVTCAACRAAVADQTTVAALLAATPPADVPADFLARLNARIDEEDSVFGAVDYKAWTLRLAPLAAVLALAAFLGVGAHASPAAATSASTTTPSTAAQVFSPARPMDWQQDVSANALLEAALPIAAGDRDVR